MSLNYLAHKSTYAHVHIHTHLYEQWNALPGAACHGRARTRVQWLNTGVGLTSGGTDGGVEGRNMSPHHQLTQTRPNVAKEVTQTS